MHNIKHAGLRVADGNDVFHDYVVEAVSKKNVGSTSDDYTRFIAPFFKPLVEMTIAGNA